MGQSEAELPAEEAIRHIYRHCMQHLMTASSISGAEWWVQVLNCVYLAQFHAQG